MKNCFALFTVLVIAIATIGQAEPVCTGSAPANTLNSVEDYLGLVQERFAVRKSESQSGGGSGGGGGGGTHTRASFSPTLEELPLTGGPRSNDPVVVHRMVRDNASETFYRAWLMESESATFKIATFAIKKVVNTHVGYEELDFHELDLVQLHYIILDSEGNELRRILIPGLVTPIGDIQFFYSYCPLLFGGQKVLSVLEMHLREGVNTPVRIHRVIAPAVNLMDPTATTAREFNFSLKWRGARWMERAVLPKHALDTTMVGAPLANQFWLLNGNFTMLVDAWNRETTLPAGASDWLIAEFILRGTGQGGLWKLSERCVSVSPNTAIEQMTLVVRGEQVLIGTRLDRGESGALWLFDAHGITFSATEEVLAEVWVNVKVDPPSGQTFLHIQDIEVGNYSERVNVMFANRFIAAHELPFSGLWDYEVNPSGIVGFSFTH